MVYQKVSLSEKRRSGCSVLYDRCFSLNVCNQTAVDRCKSSVKSPHANEATSMPPVSPLASSCMAKRGLNVAISMVLGGHVVHFSSYFWHLDTSVVSRRHNPHPPTPIPPPPPNIPSPSTLSVLFSCQTRNGHTCFTKQYPHSTTPHPR